MKNLKKVLALVLVVAMMMTFAVSASAATYKDADQITDKYVEAVDVMSAVGVFEGTDGNLNPQGNLTREQAAKIICYLVLGKANAEKLTVASSSFTDVAANRWSAPYIEYCASKGIVSGHAGKFNPKGTLKGTEFAKMLLVCLGYDATIEKMVGASWEINTANLAINAGIDNKFALSSVITREQAVQMAFSTMTATMVKYSSKGTNITMGDGTTIVTGASDAESVEITNGYNYLTGTDYADGNKHTVEFCEKYYPSLKMTDASENGLSGYKWFVGETPASALIVSEKVIGTSTNGASLTKLTAKKGSVNYDKDNFIAEAETALDFYYNGTKLAKVANSGTTTTGQVYYNTSVSKVLTAAGTTAAASDTVVIDPEAPGKGVTVKLVNSDNDSKAEKVLFEVAYFDKVSTITNTPENKTSGAYTTYTLEGGASFKVYSTQVNAEVDEAVVYDGIARNDYVMVLDLADTAATITKAATVEGKLTSKTSTGFYTIAGKTYEASALKESTSLDNSGLTTYNTDYIYYLDNTGYVVATKAVTTETDAVYAYVVNAASVPTGTALNQKYDLLATLLFADGTTKDVSISKYSTDGTTYTTITHASALDGAATAIKGDIVSYSVDGNDEYIVKTETDEASMKKPVAGDKKSTETPAEGDIYFKTVSNKAAFLEKYTANATPAWPTTGVAENLIANAKTTFVVSTTASGRTTYATYTGIANLPAMKDVQVIAATKNGVCTFVYIVNGGTIAATTSKYVVLTSTDYTFVPETKSGADDAYRIYDAIVDGEKTTVKVHVNSSDNGSVGITSPATGLFNVTYTDGVITAGTAADTTTGVKYMDGVIATKSASSFDTYYTYTDDAVVYVIDSTAGTVDKIAPADIVESATATVAVHFTKDSTTNVDEVYIIK